MDDFTGCQIFASVAEKIGISIDQFNFLTSQVIALVASIILKQYLKPGKTKAEIRHLYEIIFGLVIVYYCYGNEALYLVLLTGICYCCHLVTPSNAHKIILPLSIGFLSWLHLRRLYFHYASAVIEITGPVMIIVQKLTSLAYSVHDGRKPEAELKASQKKEVIEKLPTFLEYFSYCFAFQNVSAGPGISYKYYTNFIEGKDVVYNEACNELQQEPSATKAVLKKIGVATLCAVYFLSIGPLFPIEKIRDDDFLGLSLLYKFAFLHMCGSAVRAKYYCAWILSDSISNASGLGFKGLNEDKSTNWNEITNVDIWKFESGTNLRESVEGWNLSTNKWLRELVYERVSTYRTLQTYALSAIWHGFYPGYYITFAGGALFTVAARTARRHIRGYFLKGAESKAFYDILTFLATRMVMAYITFSFILLEFWPCVRLYMSMYWCLHVLAIVLIVLTPIWLPKSSDINHVPSNRLENTIRSVGPITNSILQH